MPKLAAMKKPSTQAHMLKILEFSLMNVFFMYIFMNYYESNRYVNVH